MYSPSKTSSWCKKIAFQKFLIKIFDYINYLYVRKDHIWSFSWKIQNAYTSNMYVYMYALQYLVYRDVLRK